MPGGTNKVITITSSKTGQQYDIGVYEPTAEARAWTLEPAIGPYNLFWNYDTGYQSYLQMTNPNPIIGQIAGGRYHFFDGLVLAPPEGMTLMEAMVRDLEWIVNNDYQGWIDPHGNATGTGYKYGLYDYRWNFTFEQANGTIRAIQLIIGYCNMISYPDYQVPEEESSQLNKAALRNLSVLGAFYIDPTVVSWDQVGVSSGTTQFRPNDLEHSGLAPYGWPDGIFILDDGPYSSSHHYLKAAITTKTFLYASDREGPPVMTVAVPRGAGGRPVIKEIIPPEVDKLGLPDLSNLLSPYDTGFCTGYVPTTTGTNSELYQLAMYFWDKTVLDKIAENLNGNSSDAIISFHAIPAPRTSIMTGERLPVYFGTVNSGIEMNLAGRFIRVTLGGVEVLQKYHNFLDFDGYTSVSLYLPFVGYVDLDVSQVMGKTVYVTYHIDICTGGAVAFVWTGSTAEGDQLVIGQWECQISRQMPITSANYNQFMSGLIQGATSALTALAPLAAIPAGVGMMAGASASPFQAAADAAMQQGSGLISKGVGAIPSSGIGIVDASASLASMNRVQVDVKGGFSTMTGQMAQKYPIMIIKRPVSAMPGAYQTIIGKPAYTRIELNELDEYAEISEPRINVNATLAERREIDALLQGGVYF